MPNRSPHGGISFSRVFGAFVGIVFLVFNLWSFRQNYLLKHSGVVIQGVVIRTNVVRHRGGMAYNVDYGFDVANKHYDGTGQTTASAYLKLRPGGPIEIRYVSSDPSISETADMSHNDVSLLLIGLLGIPVSLFILGVNFRREHLPTQYVQALDVDPVEETALIELPNGISGIAYTMYPVSDMKRARRFYEEELGLRVAQNFEDRWVEYHLWDNCFAITTLMSEALKPSVEAGGRIAFEVHDVDAFVSQLRKKGVPIKTEPFSTPACRMAVLMDPEGNAFILHQRFH